MAKAARILILSAEAKAGLLWQEAFAKSDLAVRLAVATTGIDGLLAVGQDTPEAVLIVHSPPTIDAHKLATEIRREHADLPMLVFASDPGTVAEALKDGLTVAAWADESGTYRSTAPAILARMLSYTPQPCETAAPGPAADAARAIALEIAGRAGQEVNTALQSIYGQIERIRAALTFGSPARPALESIETSLRQAAALTERILNCAKAPGGARIRIGLHELLRSVLHVLRGQLGARFSPELRLQAARTEIDAEVFSLCRGFVQFFQAWAETYGSLEGRMTLATDNTRSGSLAAPAVPGAAAQGYEVRLRVVGRGQKARGPEFDPGADLNVIQGILPVGPLGEALRPSGGRLQLALGPGGEPIVALGFPLAQSDTRHETTTGLADVRGSGHVLLLDDELIVRALAEKMLTGLGYTVTAMADGKSALSAFQADPGKFDLVLADKTLPGVSAEEVFQAMKAIRGDIRFVLASDNPAILASIKIGPGGYAGVIQKPYRVRDLGARLLKILNY